MPGLSQVNRFANFQLRQLCRCVQIAKSKSRIAFFIISVDVKILTIRIIFGNIDGIIDQVLN